MNKHEQRSKGWEAARLRFTASNFWKAVDDPKEYAYRILRLYNPTVDAVSRMRMEHGVVTEPVARKWYADSGKFEGRETGIAVPKWDVRIGASPDWMVTDLSDPANPLYGVVEIKCPEYMYKPLTEHIEKIRQGWVPPPFYHKHVWSSHYAQMMGEMACTGRQWCDYVVYATGDHRAYKERIPFNTTFWDNDLYPQITHFLDHIVGPLMNQTPHSFLDPKWDVLRPPNFPWPQEVY